MTARVQEQLRVCECCGEEFGRRTLVSGRLEAMDRFLKRRFCSRKCYRDGCAEGLRLQPPGRHTDQPHPLHGTGGTSDGGGTGRAGSNGYPWDRKRAVTAAVFPAPFSTGREMPVPNPRREA